MDIISVIIITTSQQTMGDIPKPTGLWLEELSTPYYQFIDAGFKVDIASIKGGKVPLDPRSIEDIGKNEASVDKFLSSSESMAKITATASIEDIEFTDYDVIFFPGGHGAAWDFPNQPILANAITTALNNEKVVASVCHGPAVFIGVKDSNGNYLISGKKVAGFTNQEEDAVGLTQSVPFLLENELKRMGGLYQKGDMFTPFAVKDGNLITGQNPASSRAVGEMVIEAVLNNINGKK
jgi:putative intracellular protease/amidase